MSINNIILYWFQVKYHL